MHLFQRQNTLENSWTFGNKSFEILILGNRDINIRRSGYRFRETEKSQNLRTLRIS